MRSSAVSLFVIAFVLLSAAKDEPYTSEFVKQQLDSIGSEQARGAVKNRLVQGSVGFQWLNAASSGEGQLQFVSEGDKFVSVLKLPSLDYHGEQFTSDGKKTAVKQIRPGVYSALGRFVFEHPEVLTEGLWGGTLSTAWALAHLDQRHARLEDRGLKKIDGRDLHRVDYFPKKSSDVQIELYFEPDTSRHVMTVYSYHAMARGGGGPSASAGQQERYYKLEERFADFQSIDGLTLPMRWTIQYSGDASATTTGGVTTGVSQFVVSEPKISHNISLDPRNFAIN